MLKKLQIIGLVLFSLLSFNAFASDDKAAYSDAIKSFKSDKSTQTGTTGSGASTSGGKNSLNASASYHKGMATFTVPKGGLMYETSLSGQSFSFDAK